MTFGAQVIDFHRELKPDWKIPAGIDLIYPFDQNETWTVFEKFYHTYFGDDNNRTFLFGINPGRFGAGVTGIPFTDPKILEEKLEIKNPFHKRNELSSVFVYEMIDQMGGPNSFYTNFYITSICPLGFIREGKNINYYDLREIESAVYDKIISNIEQQIKMGANLEVAYSMGQGKNFKFLQKINQEHQYFEKVVPLPHPRWVMQYRLKRKQEYLDEYISKLNSGLKG